MDEKIGELAKLLRKATDEGVIAIGTYSTLMNMFYQGPTKPMPVAVVTNIIDTLAIIISRAATITFVTEASVTLVGGEPN